MIETREYPVPLTDEELKTAADFVGLIHKSIQDREAAFEEIRQEYKHSIKELRSGLAVQLEKLSTRREVREVELEILYNSPEKGMKQIFLNSTGTLIDTVEMTADDEQDLFADAESREESDGSDGSDESEEEDRENPAPEGVGETGGAVCHKCRNFERIVVHIGHDPICLPCLEKRNRKYIAKLDELEAHWKEQDRCLEFRAITSESWDTTCFSFMMPSGAWGNPIYCIGDHRKESSEAAIFKQTLVFRGFIKNLIPGVPEEVQENPAPEGVEDGPCCSVCGGYVKLYHINNGKKICVPCMLNLPQEKRVKELLESGHPFSFRASAGFGNTSENNDTTNFRFIDHSPEAAPKEPWRVRSWGMGIWRPGNFLDEGTPAYEFYQLLQLNPNGTEN